MRSSKTTMYYKSFYCDFCAVLRGSLKSVNENCLHFICIRIGYTYLLFECLIQATEIMTVSLCLTFWQKTTTFNKSKHIIPIKCIVKHNNAQLNVFSLSFF